MAATCRTMTAFSLACNKLTTRGRCKLDSWWAAYMQNHLRVHQSAPTKIIIHRNPNLAHHFYEHQKKIKSIDEIFLFFIFYCNYSKIRFMSLNLLIWIKYKISFRARNSPHHYLNSIDFKLYNRAKILHAGHSQSLTKSRNMHGQDSTCDRFQLLEPESSFQFVAWVISWCKGFRYSKTKAFLTGALCIGFPLNLETDKVTVWPMENLSTPFCPQCSFSNPFHQVSRMSNTGNTIPN